MRYQDNPLIRKKYNSTKWQKVRKLKILQTNGLCERCLKEHKYEPGVIVHHKEYINEGNYFDDDVMYSFLLRELITYTLGKNYNIFYWVKQRAKAKVSIIIEKSMDKKAIIIPVEIAKKENVIPRNVQSFQNIYKAAIPIYINRPSDEMVEDGEVIFDRLGNIT